MRKEIKLISLIFLMLFFSLLINGCSFETQSYTVSFDSNGGSTINSIQVEKGRLITADNLKPSKEDGAMFLGWYLDKDFTEKWQFDKYIVTDEMTLFAKWRLLTNYPSEVAMTNEAFSSSLKWIQSDVLPGKTKYSVLLAKGIASVDADGNISYSYGKSTPVEGTFAVADDQYTITWTPYIIPQAGVYRVTIQTTQPGSTTNIKDISFDDAVFKGAGTLDNPYIISTANDLDAITKAGGTVGNGKYYRQLNDITDATSNNGNGTIFAGIYDGNNKMVTITGDATGGLFYQTSGTVKNLTISGSIVSADTPSIGLLANFNSGTIQNVSTFDRADSVKSTAGTVGEISTKDQGLAGGIVGTNLKNGVISNSVNNARILAYIGGGGIAGQNFGVIENCLNYGRIGAGNALESGKSKTKASYSYMGGIVGFNYGTISRSGNSVKADAQYSGNVFAQRNDVDADSNKNISLGGIAGYNGNTGVITEVFNTAERVHGDFVAGGIAGTNGGIIEYSYSSTAIAARDQAGGLVGESIDNGMVKNSYSTGTVTVFNTGSTAYALAKATNNCVYIADAEYGLAPEGDNNISGNPSTSNMTSILGSKFTATGKFTWQN